MTTVQLFGDIGLYANYKKTIDFSTISEQNAWFNSKQKTTIQNVIYNKPYNSLKLNMQYGQAMQYSYARLLDLDTTGRIYYFFISTVNVIDDATVEFIFEPDVIQTYMTYWSLGESMVNRAHVDRWSDSSADPIRITPNTEGINASYAIELNTNLYTYLGDDSSQDYQVVFPYIIYKNNTTNNIVMLASMCFPFIAESKYVIDIETGSTTYHLMDISAFVSNNILATLGIDPEAVVTMGISTIPLFEYTFESKTSETLLDRYTITTIEALEVKEEYALIHVPLSTGSESISEIFRIISYPINDERPVKPTNNATASDTFEPALYMMPYRNRYVNNPSASIYMEVPDIFLLRDEYVSFIALVSASVQNELIVVGEELDNLGSSVFLPDKIKECYNNGLTSTTIIDGIDLFNNTWLTYALTQREADRQILNNNIISSALQGLIFGSYGGALVTSRGTGGKDKRSLGRMATRMVPGIALGGIASAGSALIDGHFAWENQLLEERKIQNKAQSISVSGNNGAMNAGYGLSTPSFTVLKCDDVNYERAYNNFRKYGYLINEFTSLNIKSRKYYNYILTNGACIEGAIPEDARDLISQIFDSGVTIFHGDYCDTLEYPTYENIERSLIQ